MLQFIYESLSPEKSYRLDIFIGKPMWSGRENYIASDLQMLIGERTEILGTWTEGQTILSGRF